MDGWMEDIVGCSGEAPAAQMLLIGCVTEGLDTLQEEKGWGEAISTCEGAFNAAHVTAASDDVIVCQTPALFLKLLVLK